MYKRQLCGKLQTSVEEVEQQEQYELICPKVQNKQKNLFWNILYNSIRIFSILAIIITYLAILRAIIISFAIWHIQYDTYVHLNLASEISLAIMFFHAFIAYLIIFYPKYSNLCTYYYGYKLNLFSFTILCSSTFFDVFLILSGFGFA